MFLKFFKIWNNTSCKEGQIGLKCTVNVVSEGEFSIGVSATDDDGETVFATYVSPKKLYNILMKSVYMFSKETCNICIMG